MGGSLKGKKIAYVYYDNPAGHEPMPILEDLQKIEGFEMRTFAVPPPGVEMGAQVLDITQRYRPDFVIDPSVRPLAVGGDQGIQARRLSAVEGDGPRLGLGRGRYPGGRWLGGGGGLSHDVNSPGPATTIRSARKSRRCTRRRARSRQRRWTTR